MDTVEGPSHWTYHIMSNIVAVLCVVCVTALKIVLYILYWRSSVTL